MKYFNKKIYRMTVFFILMSILAVSNFIWVFSPCCVFAQEEMADTNEIGAEPTEEDLDDIVDSGEAEHSYDITAFEEENASEINMAVEKQIVTSEADLIRAIENAGYGDTIYVSDFDMPYRHQFSLSKDVNVTIASGYDDRAAILTVTSPLHHLDFASSVNVTIKFENVIFDGNGAGGSIRFYGKGKTLDLDGAVFQNIRNPMNGGAIHLQAGSIRLNSCRFTNISAEGSHGSAVYVKSGDAYVNNSRFLGNYAGYSGAALYVSDDLAPYNIYGNLEVYGSVFENNVTDSSGGAINVSGSANIYNSIFRNNTTSTQGGAISKGSRGDITIRDSLFEGNRALADEAAQKYYDDLYASYGLTAPPLGGGAISASGYNGQLPSIVLESTKFTNNTALYGGALNCVDTSRTSVSDCLFENNSAALYGGGIYTSPLDSLTADTSTIFRGNTAASYATWTVDAQNDKTPFSLLHDRNIKATVFSAYSAGGASSEFTNGYNNYDINMLKADKPAVNETVAGVVAVSGVGIPDAEIDILLPGGVLITTVTDSEGKWSVDVPSDITLKAGDKIAVVQREIGKVTSDAVVIILPEDTTTSSNPKVSEVVPVPNNINRERDVARAIENTAYYYDIPDESVPLGYVKTEAEDENGETFWMILPEDEVPLSSLNADESMNGQGNVKENPQTGDRGDVFGIAFMLLVAGMVLLVIKGLKKERR